MSITDRFTPIVEGGAVVGMRATVTPPLLRVGKGANQLRVSVRGREGGRLRKDVDRVRFRAVAAANRPPVARVIGGNTLLFPGTPAVFDGSQSYDPDGDTISYQWDLGDGTTSTDVKPTHVYDVQHTDVTLRLTVTDTINTATDTAVLFTTPEICAGCTVGQLAVEGEQSLEFGALAPGADATRTVTLRNTDATPTSQVAVRLHLEGASFTVEPTELALDAGASAAVTVRFRPGAAGHQTGSLTVVANSQHTGVVHLLGHGYAGTAPDNGPTLAETPLYYLDLSGHLQGVLPDGGHFPIDNAVSTCLGSGGLGTHDLCLTTADCNVAGEQCVATAGQRFDPVDMCTAGDGHLYLLSDDIFTDFSTGDEHSVGVLDLGLTAQGARTGAKMVRHTTTETGQVACDRLVGGSLYLPEVRGLASPARCFRDSREALVAVNRRVGTTDTLLQRIDGVEGFDECNDDIDPATDLEVTADGTAAYVTLDGSFDTGGLYRVLPTPLWISSDVHDYFQLHPDGSVLYLTVTNATGLAVLSLYKLVPEQAVHGRIRLADLTPCATFSVPNNGGFVTIDLDGGSFAVAPAGNGFDAVVVATFITGRGVLPTRHALNLRGTVAFSVPASGICTTLGLTSVDYLLTPRF